MQIKVTSQRIPVDPPLRRYVDGRVRMTLGRFAPELRRVRVRFQRHDERSRECRLSFSLAGGRKIVVVEEANSVLLALDRACERAARLADVYTFRQPGTRAAWTGPRPNLSPAGEVP